MLPSQGLCLDPGGHLPKCSRLFASFLKRSYRYALLRFSGLLTLWMLQLFSIQTSLLKTPSILPTCTTQKLNLLKMPLSAGKHVAKWKQDIFMYTGRGLLSQAFKWTNGWRWHRRDIWREAAGEGMWQILNSGKLRSWHFCSSGMLFYNVYAVNQ